MEENTNLIESLLEKAADYGKTSYELVKLNAIDKTSNSISSFFPGTIILLVLSSVLLFFNLGMAFWLGNMVGELFLGFFIVSAFYVLITLILYLFFRKWLKRIFYDYMVRHLLK